MNVDPFAEVSFSEITFAAALFLAAAEGRLAGYPQGLTQEQEEECRQLFAALVQEPCDGTPQPGGPGHTAAQQRAAWQGPGLYTVFRSLWSHLLVHQQRSAICARVLAFHLLMERTWGGAIEGWTLPLDGEETQVELHPAVVHAIGKVALVPDRALREGEFRLQILRCHHTHAGVEQAAFAPVGALLSAGLTM